MSTSAAERNPQDERQRLQEQCDALRTKLKNLQKRRRDVRRKLEQGQESLVRAQQHCNEAALHRDRALQEYESQVCAQRLAYKRLEQAQKYNVTNDTFFIWHKGPFGTINGLRLGSEVPLVPTDPEEPVPIQTGTDRNTGTGRMGILGYSLGFSAADSPPSPTPAHQTTTVMGSTEKVPWVEINSALGLVALLLSSLERKPHSGIHFQNEIIPLGSTSRIGVRNGQSVAYYNLFSDDGFQLFGKRNFNIALNGLLRCVADAARAVQERDRTIALPHPVEIPNRGDGTIGGLSISYGPDGDRWTRAMKYLLIDLKWLIAFTTKHVDR
jgi:beclin 1